MARKKSKTPELDKIARRPNVRMPSAYDPPPTNTPMFSDPKTMTQNLLNWLMVGIGTAVGNTVVQESLRKKKWKSPLKTAKRKKRKT